MEFEVLCRKQIQGMNKILVFSIEYVVDCCYFEAQYITQITS